MDFNSSNWYESDLDELDTCMDTYEEGQILKKLKHSSAVVLCEDDALREKISYLIDNIQEKNSQHQLSSIPEAVLPLSIKILNTSDLNVKSLALECLKQIIKFQGELIEYQEKMPY